jgi:uncharacterized membrane protein
LALGYADCGENARVMFNTMTNPHELFLRVNPDKPLFYDHFHPGILPLIPLWLLWPNLKLTIVLQIVAIVGCAVPIYWLGALILKNKTSALLLVLCWLAYPSASQLIYSGTYGFRWGNLCLLLYFVALVLWVKGCHAWALVAAIWAMLIKEEAAIAVGMFGLYLTVFERRPRTGLVLTAVSFGYFLLVTSVIVPAMNPNGYVEQKFFSDLGHSKWEILWSPLTRARVFWGRLFEPPSAYFAAGLLAPLLFLPLKRPSILFVGSLTFGFVCLNPLLKSLCLHYQAALLPVGFWALASALRDRDVRVQHAWLKGVLAACVTFTLFLGNNFWSKQTIPLRLWPGRLSLIRDFRRDINPNGSLFATQRLAAHFVRQKYLYVDTPIPRSIDCVLLDMRDCWRVAVGTITLVRLRAVQR